MITKPVVNQFNHAGLRIGIYQDEDPMTPDMWCDKSLFLAASHPQFRVEGSVVKDPLDALCDNDCDPEISARYHVFVLYAYIHSGVHLRLGARWGEDDGTWEAPFDPGGWDTSRPGLVFASRGEWPDDGAAEEAARSLVSTWNDCLSGNVYRFLIEKPRRYVKTYLDDTGKPTGEFEEGVEWDSVDSCGGFIGDRSYCETEAKMAAEAKARRRQGD